MLYNIDKVSLIKTGALIYNIIILSDSDINVRIFYWSLFLMHVARMLFMYLTLTFNVIRHPTAKHNTSYQPNIMNVSNSKTRFQLLYKHKEDSFSLSTNMVFCITVWCLKLTVTMLNKVHCSVICLTITQYEPPCHGRDVKWRLCVFSTF